MRLKEKKRELALKTEIAKVEAEERVLADAEAGLPRRETKDDCRTASDGIKTGIYGTEVVAHDSQRPPAQLERYWTFMPTETGKERPKIEERTSEYSTSSEEGFRQLMDLQRQQRKQNRDMMTMQQRQNQQGQQLLIQQQIHTLALTLPQAEVPTFAGNRIEYCNFVRALDSMIEAKTTNASARMLYLMQYPAGDVKELMSSCLAMDPENGYREAWKLLAKRYSQPYRIASAYVERSTNGPTIKAEDGAALQTFSVLLTSCKNTLSDIGYLSKIENPDSLKKIVARPQNNLRQKWRVVADDIMEENGREVTIAHIANFVEKKARIQTHPIFGDSCSESRIKGVHETRRPTNRTASSFAAEVLDSDIPIIPGDVTDPGKGPSLG